MSEAAVLAPRTVTEVLEASALAVVFQPVVSLPAAETVAFVALIRGPKDSPLEAPGALFAAARAAGTLKELDCACQEAALKAALSSGLTRPFGVFVKVEADLGHDLPGSLRALYAEACSKVRIVVEVTQEALTDEPARVLARVHELRKLGCLVALGHVGGETGSLAVMSLLKPDVIKLDMSLVRGGSEPPSSGIVHAVGAEAWRRGIPVVAEGLEEQRQVELACSMGATFGQGWHFSSSSGLSVNQADALLARETPAGDPAGEPFSATRFISESPAVRIAAKPVVAAVSRHLEEEAAALGTDAVLLARFEHARFLTPGPAERLARIARRSALCAVFGPDMPEEPVPGVSGTALPPGGTAAWKTLVISPHFAAALVAVEIGHGGPERERRFRYVLTYDRPTVVAAARALIARGPR